MHREACDTLLLCRLYECIQKSEAIYFRLKVVVEERLEGTHLRIHNHYIACDTVLTECYTLISNSHGKIVDTVVLQGLGNLYSSSTIAVSLNHTYQLGLCFQERAIPVEVINNGIEVHFQNCFVYLLYQEFCQTVKTELSGTFQQDNFIV